MKILAIYDNSGKTTDRYTVVISKDDDYPFYDILGLSEGGGVFSQWTSGQYNPGGGNRHLGKQVHFENLTEATQAHIARRIFQE